MSQSGVEWDILPDQREMLKRWAGRIFRSASYALVTFILVSVNTYRLDYRWSLAIVIGIMGGGTTSARYGLFAIDGLLAMAVVPLDALASAVAVLK